MAIELPLGTLDLRGVNDILETQAVEIAELDRHKKAKIDFLKAFAAKRTDLERQLLVETLGACHSREARIQWRAKG